MKKTLKIASLVLVIAMLAMTLVSCSVLTGTYSLGGNTLGATYEFKFGGKVIITAKLLGQEASFEGKYKIDDDKITFTFEDEDAKEYAGEFDFAKGKEDGKSYIKIGGVSYTKE